MDELEMLKYLNILADGEKLHDDISHLLKYLDIIKGKIQYDNHDINTLIKHFENEEMFELCVKLKKLKK